MGKLPMYTDSEETEDTTSSLENINKKKKFSILKYTTGSMKKKKCRAHSVSEPEEQDYRTRVGLNQRTPPRKLRGILKHDRDRESSEEEEDLDEPPLLRAQDKYLVGRVPRPAGSRPGRGGGLSILIRKNTAMTPLQSLFQTQGSESGSKRRRILRKLSRKRSY